MVIRVLNLVISGIPSIQKQSMRIPKDRLLVLNLVISGIPSIHSKNFCGYTTGRVLNLVISGIPSILIKKVRRKNFKITGFKPCYKWNTFNTLQS